MSALHLSPLALLLAQIAVVLGASRIVATAFRRLGQPRVVAEIVAGILLGPSLLGWVWPEALQAIFPRDGMAWLQGVSQLGLVLFMFTVGLEFDLSLVRSRGRLALTVSQYSIVVPMALGVGLAWFLYPEFATSDVPFTGFALFMGASMAVTAFPVLARILAEQGMTRARLGAMALACAAANDVTAWCLLAVVIAVVRADGLGAAAVTTVLALGFLALMVGAVRPFLARLARRFGTTDDIGEAAIVGTLMLLLLSSLASEAIGIHALFGAFVFGAVVPREGPLVRVLRERIEHVVVILFLPTFFAFTGLKTSIGLVDTPALWGWAGVIVLVATVGKVLGTAIPARLGGLSTRDASTLGVLMNTRGLMELVILEIGRELGVLSPVLYTLLVLMAVATTLVTAPVVRLLYPRSRMLEETRATASEEGDVVVACAAHPGTAQDLGVLLGLLARPPTQAIALQLEPLSDSVSLFPGAHDIATEEQAPDAADTVQEIASATRGSDVAVQRFPSADPPTDICSFAAHAKAHLVLLGLHRPLVGTARLGGPLLAIVEQLRCDAAMLHAPRALVAPKTVLLATGTPQDVAAERIVARLPAVRVLRLAATGQDDVTRLIDAARAVDLVVVGAGDTWDLAMHAFELRGHRALDEIVCPMLVVHAPRG